MRGLGAYKLVAYEKTKSSKSIPAFSISRLGNVEDFFNVNTFFKCNYMRTNDYSFKYVCILLKNLLLLPHLFCKSNSNSADFTTLNQLSGISILKTEMLFESQNKTNIGIIGF